MHLDILTTPRFNSKENKIITAAASTLGISREQVVRRAVKLFAAQCVPTQRKAASK